MRDSQEEEKIQLTECLSPKISPIVLAVLAGFRDSAPWQSDQSQSPGKSSVPPLPADCMAASDLSRYSALVGTRRDWPSGGPAFLK